MNIKGPVLQYPAPEKDMMGTPIRRVLPVAKKRMVGHFIFLDHMGPVRFEKGTDTSVGAHPHIGLATLTYLFEGQIHHRDSLGSSQVITPGDVNWMIAGSGIAHSERGVKGDDLKEHNLHGLQFWMALPDAEEDCAPQFFNFKKSQIPKTEKSGFQITEIVGPQSAVPAPPESTLLVLQSFNRAQFLQAESEQELAVYVIRGSVQVNSQTLPQYHAALFSAGSAVSVESQGPSKIIVFGGKPYQGLSGKNEKNIFWNFVSSSKDKIKSAQENWNKGDFPMVPGERDRILSPEFKR